MPVGQHLQLAGAVIFSDLVKKPPFLLRNLDQRLHCEKDKRSRPKTARIAREDFDPQGAAFFLPGMDERLTPRLKVSINGITPGGRRSTSDTHGISLGVGIRSRRNVVDVRSRLSVSIYNKHDTMHCLHTAHRIVHLRGARRSDGRFELSTILSEGERPFEFQMDLLGDLVETFRFSMAEEYIMRFELTFHHTNSADVWDALSIKDASPQEYLWAQWVSLPRCPVSTGYLPLFVSKDTATKYALNVKMGWGTEEWMPKIGRAKRGRPSTPLEGFISMKRQKSNAQLPTPVSTPRSGSSVAGTDTMIRYHLNGNLIERHSFRCLLCGRDQRSLDRLEFHLVQGHPTLEIRFDANPTSGNALDETVVDIIVLGTSDTKQRGKGRAKFDKEDSVIDEIEWQTHERSLWDSPLILQKVTADARWSLRRGRKIKHTPPPPSGSAFAAVADIQLELPVRTRARPPIPHRPEGADSVSFISSDNKAALHSGEELSDEDDDVDEAHLRVAQRVQMMQQLGDTHEQRFLLDINSYIEDEGPHGDKLLGPCLRRWMHKRKVWLEDKAMAASFEKFMYAAWNKRYLSEEVYRSCMDVLKEIRDGPISIAVAAGAELSPEPASAAAARTMDECICGKRPINIKQTAICSNKSCIHPVYHIACILDTPAFQGKLKLPREWYCNTCLELVHDVISKVNIRPGYTPSQPSYKNLKKLADDPAQASVRWRHVLLEHGFQFTER